MRILSQPERHIIVLMKSITLKEWGWDCGAREYMLILPPSHLIGRILQKHTYIVLPAALNLSAPQSYCQLGCLRLLAVVYREQPELFLLTRWLEFPFIQSSVSASPYRTGRTSLQGFKQELAWLLNGRTKHRRSTSQKLAGESSKSLQPVFAPVLFLHMP